MIAPNDLLSFCERDISPGQLPGNFQCLLMKAKLFPIPMNLTSALLWMVSCVWTEDLEATACFHQSSYSFPSATDSHVLEETASSAWNEEDTGNRHAYDPASHMTRT